MHDVANYFVGIYQVIHSNKVIPHAKFIPKEKFAYGILYNQQHKQKNGKRKQGQSNFASVLGQKYKQAKQKGLDSYESGANFRQCSAIFVEYGIEKIDVNKQGKKGRKNEVPIWFVQFTIG